VESSYSHSIRHAVVRIT